MAADSATLSGIQKKRARLELLPRDSRSEPGEATGNQVTARAILDKASAQIESGLNRDREVQSQMMTMGAVHENLKLYERSESRYRKAVAICDGDQSRRRGESTLTQRRVRFARAHAGKTDANL